MRSSRFLLAFALLVACLALAACGGSDSDSTGSSGGSTDTAAEPTESGAPAGENNSGASPKMTEEAVAAAEEHATSLGTQKLRSDVTVGFLNFADSLEVTTLVEDEAKLAAEALGWSVDSCDGEANPTKWPVCMESLIGRGVDAIIVAVIEPSSIRPQLERAKKAGIPVINVAGIVHDDPELLAAQLSPPEREKDLTKALDEYVFERMEEAGIDAPQVSYTWFPVLAGELRKEQLLEELKERPEYEVVSSHSTNLANVEKDVRTYTQATLEAHPDVNLFWEAAAPNLPFVAQVVQERQPGSEFPERPLIVGHLDEKFNLEALRQGTADAVGVVPVQIDAWVAMDQIAQNLSTGAKFDRNATHDSAQIYGLQFEGFTVVTQENVPKEGETTPWPADVPSYFRTLWKEEFNVGG